MHPAEIIPYVFPIGILLIAAFFLTLFLKARRRQRTEIQKREADEEVESQESEENKNEIKKFWKEYERTFIIDNENKFNNF